MSAKDRLGVVLIAVSLVAAVTLLGLRVRSEGDAVVQKSGDHACGILLDVTDPMSPGQRDALQNRLRQLVRERLVRGDEFTLWVMGTHPEGRLRRVFHQIFPGRGGNPWTTNPDQIAARCDSLFERPLLHAIDEETIVGESPISPIRASIEEIAAELRSAGTNSRRLIVVSDLIEWPEPSGLGIPGALDETSVEVWLLTRPRDEGLQDGAQREFWRAYFTACGAASVTLSRL